VAHRRELRAISALVAEIVSLLSMVAPVRAAMRPRGPEFQVNTLSVSSQLDPDVAYSGDGQFTVVWFGRQGLDDLISGIHGQRIDVDGTRIGDEFLVNETFPGDETAERLPRVSADPMGNFVVVWENRRGDDGSESGVFGRRLARSGAFLGPQFLVDSYTTGEQVAPFVASATDGSFAVLWFDGGMMGEFRSDLMLKWFAPDAVPRTADMLVAATEDGRPIAPSILVDASGMAVLAWQALGIDGDGDAVVAARYDSQGERVGEVVRLNQATEGDQVSIDFALTTEGDIIGVWEGRDADGSGIYARLFGSDLVPQSDELPVNTYTSGTQRTPRVTTTGDGSFVVVWDSVGQDGDGDGVFARLFSPAGQGQGGEFQVNAFTTGSQGNGRLELAVRGTEDGSVLIVWESEGQDGSAAGIFGRGFCVEGHVGRDCGDATCVGGEQLATSDALYILQTAVGTASCADCVCDTDGSGSVTATDGLRVLRRALGLAVGLACPPCLG
jgi:hypothetical protein